MTHLMPLLTAALVVVSALAGDAIALGSLTRGSVFHARPPVVGAQGGSTAPARAQMLALPATTPPPPGAWDRVGVREVDLRQQRAA